MRRSAVLLIALALLVPSAVAQDGQTAAVVVFAEGSDVSVIRGTRLLRFDAFELLGEPLYTGDQITTSSKTYVEVQLLSSRSIVKISENTTLTITDVGTGGDSLLDVAYGRVRSRVERLTGTQSFEVRGLTAVAGVRGTEFGFDQLVDPANGEVLGRVYAFEGEVEVFPRGERAPAPALIEAGEMVTLSTAGSPSAIAPVTEIPPEVEAQWEGREIQAAYQEPEELIDRFPDLEDALTNQPDEPISSAVTPEQSVEPSTAPDATPESAEDAEEPSQEVADVPEEPSEAADGLVEVIPTGPSNDEPLAAPVGETATEADADEAAQPQPIDEAEQTERDPRVGQAIRTTGIVLTAAGITTDLVAVGLYYFGDDLFTGWTQSNTDTIGTIAFVGLGGLALGIIAILVGNAL